MTQQPHDLLHDMLAAAAGGPTREATGATVRRLAVRRRNRRRAVAAGTLSLAAAAVLVGVTVGGTATLSTDLQPRPAGPSQDVGPPTPDPRTADLVTAPTSTPAPTVSPSSGTQATSFPPTTTDGAGSTPTGLSSAQAQQGLASFRFPGEDDWVSRSDQQFPFVVTQSLEPWALLFCAPDSAPQGALAMRTAIWSGVDDDLVRQVAVFPDAALASAAFADLRARIRVCQGERTSELSPEEVKFVGGQLALADQSFWTAYVPLGLPSADADGTTTVSEQAFGQADVHVLDGNVITMASDPAYAAPGRAETVARLSDEWAQARDRYEGLLR